jgi:Asp-tRNA(Asn)/Glu-tRNA(Gln) amidotransferase A subunit family amidase
MGRAWDEGTLIRLASGFEAVTQVRQAPHFVSTLELPTGP